MKCNALGETAPTQNALPMLPFHPITLTDFGHFLLLHFTRPNPTPHMAHLIYPLLFAVRHPAPQGQKCKGAN